MLDGVPDDVYEYVLDQAGRQDAALDSRIIDRDVPAIDIRELFLNAQNDIFQVDRLELMLPGLRRPKFSPCPFGAYALLPCRDSALSIFRMEHIAPPEVGTLLLCLPYEIQERLARIDVTIQNRINKITF